MSAADRPLALQRLGQIMEGDPTNPDEALGVLNPACARDRAGALLLYPRVVGVGNYSRVGLARVRFDGDRPVGAERLGYALEPDELFERNHDTAGVEDPRVTFIPMLDRYVMAYAAFGPLGPRAALAISEDGYRWRRLGEAKFAYDARYQTDFDLYPNKDIALFPEPVLDPHGRPALAMLHRPDFDVDWWSDAPRQVQPVGIGETRPSIWLSYAPLDAIRAAEHNLLFWFDHHQLMVPEQPWESIKLGGGPPPLLTPLGWLFLYHGVGPTILKDGSRGPRATYAAGAVILDRDDPRRILYRAPEPILTPEHIAERKGVVSNVVFPTALDPRGGGQVDVYYGMADARIGAARLVVPARLPGLAPSLDGREELAPVGE